MNVILKSFLVALLCNIVSSKGSVHGMYNFPIFASQNKECRGSIMFWVFVSQFGHLYFCPGWSVCYGKDGMLHKFVVVVFSKNW